jgi:hypothetical protein
MHHRGTEGTEKILVMILFGIPSVSSVPLW